jgi:hypothetical protein
MIETILAVTGIIWGFGFLLLAALLFLTAIKSQRGLNFGHVIAAFIWPIWGIYYLVKGRKETVV